MVGMMPNEGEQLRNNRNNRNYRLYCNHPLYNNKITDDAAFSYKHEHFQSFQDDDDASSSVSHELHLCDDKVNRAIDSEESWAFHQHVPKLHSPSGADKMYQPQSVQNYRKQSSTANRFEYSVEKNDMRDYLLKDYKAIRTHGNKREIFRNRYYNVHNNRSLPIFDSRDDSTEREMDKDAAIEAEAAQELACIIALTKRNSHHQDSVETIPTEVDYDETTAQITDDEYSSFSIRRIETETSEDRKAWRMRTHLIQGMSKLKVKSVQKPEKEFSKNSLEENNRDDETLSVAIDRPHQNKHFGKSLRRDIGLPPRQSTPKANSEEQSGLKEDEMSTCDRNRREESTNEVWSVNEMRDAIDSRDQEIDSLESAELQLNQSESDTIRSWEETVAKSIHETQEILSSLATDKSIESSPPSPTSTHRKSISTEAMQVELDEIDEPLQGEENVMIDLIRKQRYDIAEQRLHFFPQEAMAPISDSNENLALHELIKGIVLESSKGKQRRGQMQKRDQEKRDMESDLLWSLMDANPRALQTPGNGGYLPLHMVCSSAFGDGGAAIRLRLVTAMLKIYPEGAHHKINDTGELPLHLAIRWICKRSRHDYYRSEEDEPIVMCLLLAYPRGASIQDRSGLTPHDILKKVLCREQEQHLREYGAIGGEKDGWGNHSFFPKGSIVQRLEGYVSFVSQLQQPNSTDQISPSIMPVNHIEFTNARTEVSTFRTPGGKSSGLPVTKDQQKNSKDERKKKDSVLAENLLHELLDSSDNSRGKISHTIDITDNLD